MPTFYRWPASALTTRHMHLLHRARSASQPRKPMTQLIAEAVEQVYGVPTKHQPSPDPRKESE